MIAAKTASGAILLVFVVTTLGHAQSLVDVARLTPYLRVDRETSGVNTIREQAMADYMRAAGFGSGLAPAQSGR